MKSLLLTFNKKSVGTMYGFREIDISLKSKSSREITSSILNNNLIYEVHNEKFKKKPIQPIDVSLKKNSIIFCEVKNSFPYTLTKGDQKYDIIKLKQTNEYDLNDNNVTFTYLDQLDNLYKKSKLFLDFYLKENIITRKDLFHIIYLYDDSNISNWEGYMEDIEINIKGFFEKLEISNDIKTMKNFVFQIAYFNKEQYIIYKNEKKDNKIKELEKKGKEDYETIKELEKKEQEDSEKIKELENLIAKLKKEYNIELK